MARKVVVEGLRDLQRELRAIDKALPRELRAAHKEVATTVHSAAQGRASRLNAQARKAAHSRGFRVIADQRSAGVALRSDPESLFALGTEFGAKQYPQFPAWRGSDEDAGYWLHPTLRDEADHIVDEYEELLMRLLEKAFPDG